MNEFISSSENVLEPTEYTCEALHSINVDYKLDFRKFEFRYIVSLPKPLNRDILNNKTSVLELYKLPYAEDGIYTWILCDFGDENEKQFFVKKVMDITEIGTKHTDILKDICNNKSQTNKTEDNSYPFNDNSIIRVYCGGELSKSTQDLPALEYKDTRKRKRNKTHKKLSTKNNSKKSYKSELPVEDKNEKISVRYEINFMSGSYSENKVDPVNFSCEIEDELKEIFHRGMCNNTVKCSQDYTLDVLRTNETMIKLSDESIDDFETKMINTYSRLGVKIYKFNMENPEHKNMYFRAGPYAESTYLCKLTQLHNMHTRGIFDDVNYEIALKEIDDKYKPLTEEELNTLLIQSSGGRRKYKRKNKTKKLKHKITKK